MTDFCMNCKHRRLIATDLVECQVDRSLHYPEDWGCGHFEEELMTDPERRLDPPEAPVHTCPICGAEEPERIICAPEGTVLGCDRCLCMYDAWEYFEEVR